MTKVHPGEKNSINKILEKALQGNGITVDEANILIDPALTDFDQLIETSNAVTRRFFGNTISMCAIYPAKVGLCSGDCAFCSQSAHHTCDIIPVEVNQLNEQEIVDNAKELWRLGIRRYSLVTSSEALTNSEFNRILHIFKTLQKETEIGLCASLGCLTPERAAALKDVGVCRYHHNIETSPGYFPHICSTHTYEDKLMTIKTAQQAGMEICSGGILAMGETPKQRVEMAFVLKELAVSCIPINILNPIPGTRLAHQQPPKPEEILRAIAVFRLILPQTSLRFAGGRENALGSEEYLGYTAGIDAMLAGNYLTTSGKDFALEMHNLKAAGFVPSDRT